MVEHGDPTNARSRSLSGGRAEPTIRAKRGSALTHLRIWKFRPLPERLEEFVRAYDGGGTWADLFRQARGYLGTSLLRPSEPGGWWVTIDRWQAVGDFDAFQRDFGEQYRALDFDLEGVAGDEEFVGAFEED